MKVEIGDYPSDDSGRSVSIEISDSDVYSLDSTLALVITPTLKKLKGKKKGAPFIADEDVPENIRSTNATQTTEFIDEFWQQRWDYVLDEMIWGFENYDKISEFHLFDEDSDEFTEKLKNSLRLFGKYYFNLWY